MDFTRSDKFVIWNSMRVELLFFGSLVNGLVTFLSYDLIYIVSGRHVARISVFIATFHKVFCGIRSEVQKRHLVYLS